MTFLHWYLIVSYVVGMVAVFRQGLKQNVESSYRPLVWVICVVFAVVWPVVMAVQLGRNKM